jgi:DNA-binding response OmpR family regulator
LQAGSGEETIDFTVLKRPDLILINTDLPGIGGFEIVRLIRAIKCFDKMPIIFVSGETERAFRKQAFAAGGDGYYFAPLDLDRLDTLLENFLFR